MRICGLKLTHDGGIAVIEDDRLVFSVEMEKIANRARHAGIDDLAVVTEVLQAFGYTPDRIDRWVIDGWDGRRSSRIELASGGLPIALDLAPYKEGSRAESVFEPQHTGKFPLGGKLYPYTSHVHVAGHVASAYGASPFGQSGEDALVLVWDGGCFPRLYHVQPDGGIENGGELFRLTGHTYAVAAHHFGPFQWDKAPTSVNEDLSVAGKLMAYIGLGQSDESIVEVLEGRYREHFLGDGDLAVAYRREIAGTGSTSEPVLPYMHRYFAEVKETLRGRGLDADADADILASVHVFLERLLTAQLREKVRRWKGEGPWNLCFVGGCALNIKWNSTLRGLDFVRDVWVPPYPNDAGSAIGAAALGRENPAAPLDWHVRLGPHLRPTTAVPADWTSAPMTAEALGRYLHETGRACIVLDGRAELGPRALGGRSILAPATSPHMKAFLNDAKRREPYRPVAPLCLEEEAPRLFSPGVKDPYMLFDHVMREEWRERIPAVLHLDGTARLQTVGPEDGTVRTILESYFAASGVPVLCNTSANLNGSGFFPDVASAIAWGEVDLVWSEGTLYSRRSS